MSYHVFNLPPELLQTLTPRHLLNSEPYKAPSPEPSPNTTTTAGAASRACNICLGITFDDVDQQRSHYRSDWHRYNVKTKLKGGSAVNESEFNQLIDGLEDSLSGSESSSEDSESGDSDAVAILVNRRKHINRSPSPSSYAKNLPRTALAWFHSPPSTQLGVYRYLFPLDTAEASYLAELQKMQTPVEDGRTWAMFMVAGGHFAGAVVRVSPAEEEEDEEEQSKRKKKPKRPKPDTEVIKHKTFHRYTTRRKQGGGQSANDNAKGNAKSAGAQLRRYGEQALRDDIRTLIQDWAEDIDGCERIWIRASGSNRKIFMDYEGSIISKTDIRLRTFPFPTRRPTQSELGRCLQELTRVKVSHLTEEALREQDEAYLASLPKPKPPPTVTTTESVAERPKPIKLTKEEEALREKWSRLLDMVNKGRLEPLKTFWEREGANLGGADVRIPEWAGEKGRATLLQVAVQAGQEDVTRWLLEEARADPTIEVPSLKADDDAPEGEGEDVVPGRIVRRTAYDLAKVKDVRDVFRRCAGDHPDWWDWFGAGHVPSALNKDVEEEREEKKKIRRKGLKERLKEREKEKEKLRSPSPPPVVETAKPVESTGPRRLGGAAGSADGVAGLTPEMRAKVERERRARAAEARLKALGSKA